MRTLVLGTAGHIDHGKTTLVRALTGKDTDRLPEEKARGISIDLGYAPLELPEGVRLSVVDVPGHERFVRTMIAGATGIDLFLLVVDAAEGARPQTHEHLAILRLLGVARGVAAVTKADLVDGETLELALEETLELVPDSEVVAVSARTGDGLEALRQALARAAAGVERAHAEGRTRLFVDRAFTLRGIGTVATGTLWSGTVREGDELRVEPHGGAVRVRSIQVHDRSVAEAHAGQRVAVGLPGVDRAAVRRGHALVAPGAYRPSYRVDVVLDELHPIADGARVQVHHGTAETPAAVRRVGERAAQLRLEQPIVAARGDRVVLRSGTTLGGGLVIDPVPPRHRSDERMQLVERGQIGSTIYAPVREESVAHLTESVPDGVRREGGWLFSDAWLDALRAELESRIDAADPLDPGVPPPSAPWATPVVPLLGLERRGARLYRPGATGSLGPRSDEAERVLAGLGLEPVRIEDRRLAAFLETEGALVRVGDGLAVSAAEFARARELLVGECRASGRITLARFRDLLGAGRRTAQLLLERFDADGLTRRVGDERVLRRRASG